MNIRDEAAIANQKLWEKEVKKGCGYTIPWLDLDVTLLHQYASGKLKFLPEPMVCIYPASVLANMKGRDVLCLASGGGQQSAVFSILGAQVTVVDLAEGQLEGDRKAARHYGYELTTLQADMRDLSCLNANSFDLVFQANSTAYVPDIRQVYSEVSRVLRLHGTYRVDNGNPAIFSVKWDGAKYEISDPYSEKIKNREDGGIEFRHYMDDIFNGLLDSGFSIQRVYEEPFSRQKDSGATPGS